MTDTRKAQLSISTDATGAKKGFEEVKQAGRDMAQSIDQSAKQAGKSVDGIGNGADGSAQKFDRATKSIISSVQRATAAFEAGEKGTAKYFETLANQRGADPAALKPYLDALRAVETAQGRVGISAAQTSAALRGVPAQMTDIVTSLASGQQPLTVLLQQGGQLKDMFGGIGNAARALGGYMLGLINPFTVLAAATAAVGLAWYHGSKEAEAYSKALILSGNAAGTTVGQLQQMAANMSRLGVTQGAAAEALAAFAQNANVGRDSLERFASSAIAFSKVTGQSVGEVAKQFADLAKDPLTATLKLNESMNYLSMATYQSIKALQDQGRTLEAAALAQKAFAEAGTDIGRNYAASLGTLERGWNAVTGAIKRAWDAAKAVGREAGPEAQLAAVQAQLAERQASLREYGNRGGLFGDTTQQQIAALREQESILQSQVREMRKGVDLRAEEAARVKARAEADKDGLKYLSDQEKMQREIAQQTATLVAAGASRVEIEQRVAQIKASYAKKGPAAAQERQEIDSTLASIRQRVIEETRLVGILESRSGTEAKSTDAQRQAIRLQQELAGTMDKSTRAAKERQLAELQTLIPLEQRRILLETLRKEEEAQLKAIFGTVDATNERASAQEQANATFGKGAAALAELTLANLQQQRADLEATDNVIPGYVAALELRIEAQRRLVRAMKEGDELQAKDKAAKELAAEWQRYADQINRSLTDSLMRGFESGKSFAQNLKDAVVNMFKTMVLRPIVQFVVGGVTGVLGIPGAAAANPLGALGQASSLLNVGDTISKVYSTITGGFAKLGQAVGASAADMGAWLMNNTTGVLNKAGAGLINNAGAIGSGAGLAAGALAGYGLGKMISGQYTTGLGRNTLEVGGTAVGAFLGGPLGAALGGAIGGLVNRAFGRGPQQVTGEGLRGTFSTEGADVQSFQSWFQKGGWFRSNRSGTNFSAISGEMDQFLDGALRMTSAATKEYAKIVGLNADALTGFTKQIDISLKGLDAAGREKAIADAISGFGEDLARAALGDAGIALQRQGETASAALVRLATSLGGVNDVLKSLGQTLLASSLTGASSAQALLDAFGGIDAYASAAGQYLQGYYTDAERAAIAQRNITDALRQYGLALPSSISGYRQLVEAQDLSTDAGRAAYAALLQLAPAFAEVAKASGDAAASAQELQARQQAVASQRAGLQDQLDQLLGNTAALRERERAALDESNRALFDQIQALKDQQTAAEAAAAAEKARVDAIKSASTTVLDEIKRLRGVNGLSTNQAFLQAQFATLTGQARAGDAAALSKLPEISQAIEQASKISASSALDMARMRAWLATSLSDTIKALGLDVPAFAGGGMHAGGIRLVGEHGPELEVTGPARYLSATQTAAALSGGGGAMVAELRALRAEMQGLRAEARATAVATDKSARVLDRVTQGSDSLMTQQVTP